MTKARQIAAAVLAGFTLVGVTSYGIVTATTKEPLRNEVILPTEVTSPSWTPFTRAPRPAHPRTVYYPPGYVPSPGR